MSALVVSKNTFEQIAALALVESLTIKNSAGVPLPVMAVFDGRKVKPELLAAAVAEDKQWRGE
jgi:hypothetical protein